MAARIIASIIIPGAVIIICGLALIVALEAFVRWLCTRRPAPGNSRHDLGNDVSDRAHPALSFPVHSFKVRRLAEGVHRNRGEALQ